MKKARPNWQNYFVAVCLMALAFYGYLFLAGSSNHGHNIFLYLMVAGMACGAAVSGWRLLRRQSPAVLAAVCGLCLLVWLCIPGHDQLMSVLLGCSLICYAALVPSAARLLAVSGSQKA